MQIKKHHISTFVKTFEHPATRAQTGSIIKGFSEYCEGKPDTDLLPRYRVHLHNIGRASTTIVNQMSLLNRLAAFVGDSTENRPAAEEEPAPIENKPATRNAVLDALENVDAAGIACALKALEKTYHDGFEKMLRAVAPVDWDAESWDGASKSIKQQYEGLRRFKNAIAFIKVVMQYKAEQEAGK